MVDKGERLAELKKRMEDYFSREFPKSCLWFFGDRSRGVDGYLGTEPVMFVGKNPSRGGRVDLAGHVVWVGNAPQVLERFYNRLKKYGFARAHVTDIVKEAMPANEELSDQQVERNWPFFCKELSIVEPAVVVALGWWVFNTLEQRLGRQFPLLRFTHYAYRYKSRGELEERFRKEFECLQQILKYPNRVTWQGEG
jgi:uracil-DNA glycosylase family 4